MRSVLRSLSWQIAALALVGMAIGDPSPLAIDALICFAVIALAFSQMEPKPKGQ